MRVLAFVCSLFSTVAAAEAQTVEVGGRIAAGCIGSDGSLCGEKAPLAGGHISLWFADKYEISAGAAHLGLASFTYLAPNASVPIDITVSDRSRDVVPLLFVYHFMKDRAVRPMLGIGSGWYSDAERVACQPAGCSIQLRGGPLLGQYRTWNVDAVFVVGLSSIIRDRWVVRGGWQSHRFGNDENMTQQFFVSGGYRFGR